MMPSMHNPIIRYWIQSKKGTAQWQDVLWFNTRAHAEAFLRTFTLREQRNARIKARTYHWIIPLGEWQVVKEDRNEDEKERNITD